MRNERPGIAPVALERRDRFRARRTPRGERLPVRAPQQVHRHVPRRHVDDVPGGGRAVGRQRLSAVERLLLHKVNPPEPEEAAFLRRHARLRRQLLPDDVELDAGRPGRRLQREPVAGELVEALVVGPGHAGIQAAQHVVGDVPLGFVDSVRPEVRDIAGSRRYRLVARRLRSGKRLAPPLLDEDAHVLAVVHDVAERRPGAERARLRWRLQPTVGVVALDRHQLPGADEPVAGIGPRVGAGLAGRGTRGRPTAARQQTDERQSRNAEQICTHG